MPDQPTARQIAEQLMTNSARGVLYGDLRATVSELGLPKEEFTALRSEIADLITQAVVTITWPDEADAPPCTCFTTNPHAVNCEYRYWKALRGETP